MNFMAEVESDLQSHMEASASRSKATNLHAVVPYEPKQTAGTDAASSVVARIDEQLSEPATQYHKVRERMMEMELERDEQAKALKMLKEARQREKNQHEEQIELVRNQGGEYAEQVKAEMAARIEKQVTMLESLLEDKKEMQEQVEQMTARLSENSTNAEKQKKLLEDRLAVELKKNRDAWVASEKVRNERWEKEKV